MTRRLISAHSKTSLAIAGLLALATPHLMAQRPVSGTQDTLRVLFLGNSYFWRLGDSYQAFEGFCESAGLYCEAVSQGEALTENTHGIEFAGLGRGHAVNWAWDERAHQLIRDGDFDFVVLWAGFGTLVPEWVADRDSQEPWLIVDREKSIPYEETLAAMTALHRTIVESGARTVLYMGYAPTYVVEWMHPVSQVYRRLRADLERLEILDGTSPVALVPIGLFWLDAVALSPVTAPTWPTALKPRFSIEEWYSDPRHGTPIAHYANGCFWFTYLTGLDPRSSSFADLPLDWEVPDGSEPEVVPAEVAQWIKEQVWLYYSTGR